MTIFAVRISLLTKLFAVQIFLSACPSIYAQVNYASYVNPFIGTGGHGHTFPGSVLPFGMVQLSPDTRIDGSWDGCSGYHYSDKSIYGFSHTHLSGTGCSDYGDIALLPYDAKKLNKNTNWLKLNHKFQHKNEIANAGYYKVKLDNGIICELTSGLRFGMHKYTFPKKSIPGIVVKITHRDKTIASDMKVIDEYHIEGYRRSEAWAKDQYIYFVIEVSSPLTKGVGQGFGNSDGNNGIDYETYTFEELNGQPLFVKVGISNVSIEGAKKNLASEINDWDFESVKTNAYKAWNSELGKIEIDLKNKDKATIFYSALYHCMIHPSLASDSDGKYRGRDNKIHEAKNFSYYSVFSLWDTFRALHPLLTLIDKKRTSDFINTFLAQYEQGGSLPVWELSSNETDCMIGYHAVPVITDAYVKGVRGFDENLAITAMKASAKNNNYRGLGVYDAFGLLEIDNESESVSKTLEYAYDDWCIATFLNWYCSTSRELGNNRTQLIENFQERAVSWRNLFDAQTGFIRPRSNGGWLIPFEPREVNNNFTEANAWQYTFFVPHDINTMIDYLGGKNKFENKLDELFSTSSQTTGRIQADITGLIGQYAHGNEPSHHMAYLYNFVGAPYKTQEKIHKIATEFYKNSPDGLIGNEDCGQMSAWYVFSAMGFYPVCPGKEEYIIGTPSFEKIILHPEPDINFTIEAKNLNENSFYHNNPKLFISHDQISKNGNLIFEMKNTTDKVPFTSGLPINKCNIPNFIEAPFIVSNGKTFKSMNLIEIKNNNSSYTIEYTFGDPFCRYDTCALDLITYTSPFPIDNSCVFYARNKDKFSNYSKWVKCVQHKINNDYTIKIISKYNTQYSAGGDYGIIDGLHGDTDWRKGGWQGYQAQNFECVIDLKNNLQINSIKACFLQDAMAWIFMPDEVEYYYSQNGIDFIKINSLKNSISDADKNVQTKAFHIDCPTPVNANFIKIVAKNHGQLPTWHPGYGMKGDSCFIFIDEIEIK